MLQANLYTQHIDVAGINLLLFDVVAFVWYVALWVGYATYATVNYNRSSNLMFAMDQMRIQWMRQVLKRDSRIVDGTLVGNLLRSISFFANTSIFILIGLVTVLGYRDSAVEMIKTVPFAVASTTFMWELKVFNLMFVFIYAFFKFTWSLRQYNYCCILVGAAPLPSENRDGHEAYAVKAGNLIAIAGRHFNMGMRAFYFGLAAICWFLHPAIFMGATALVVMITYRREFRSQTVHAINGLSDGY